ncbi:ImuA family protein [Taklimakanibacter lacteus]|uniref:ImuA family protein n=1 Tax=Taklimakanibacter lacteus TaxID=2268456 RepID=UPI000E66DCFB
MRQLLASPPPKSLKRPCFSFELPLDRHLPRQGLSLESVHEIHAATPEDQPAALGFLIALMAAISPGTEPLFIVTSAPGLLSTGRLYGHGLNMLGLDPGRITLVEARNDIEALWAIEEILHSGAARITAGLLSRSLDLKKSQRLSLAAREARRPLLVLRPPDGSAASAVETRWSIAAAPAHRSTSSGLIAPCWQVRLERCRNGWPGEFVLEWHHASHRFGLAAALADPALPDSAGGRQLGHA